MKAIIKATLTLYFIFAISYLSIAQISINDNGNSPDASAMLEITSSSKGILIPRMTTAELTAISSPATGLLVYDTDEDSFWYYSNSTWNEISGSGFNSKNDITYSNNNDDDFVFGADSLNHGSGVEYKFFFDKSLGAFRAGGLTGTQWDESNLGTYSSAFGYNTTASGNFSSSFGYNTTASGTYSSAFGRSTVASGDFSTSFGFYSKAVGNYSTSFGYITTAYSYGETVFGMYNTVYTPNSETTAHYDDRLFVIGNGFSSSNRSDAMIIYKNGDTEINGALTLNNVFTFPTTDGDTLQILTTDGNGTLSWSDVSSDTLTNTLEDTDADTKIQVEESSDDDIIRFDLGGTEFMRLNSGRIEIVNTGNSVFLGEGAGENDDYTENRNILIGNDAGTAMTTGQRNVYLGFRAGVSATSAYHNIFLGYKSGFSNTTGYKNTVIGYDAGYLNVTGNSNVFLGNNAGYSETGSNKLYIENSNTSSPLIYGDFDNDRLVINGNDTVNSNNRTLFVNGSIGATSAFNNDSDRRLKEDIQTIPNALDKVLEMRGVTYKWKDGREAGDRMGFIAQEVEPILPQVVDNKNDHYTMQYAPITAVLIEAVKEQQAAIEQLKKENQQLKAQASEIQNLKIIVQQLQAQLEN